MATAQELITQLYVGYFNRSPDPEGLAYWVARVEAGASIEAISQSFSQSPEARALYDFFDEENGASDIAGIQTFLKEFYLNVFGREIDADGLAYYTAQISDGVREPGQIGNSILINASTNTASGNTDQAFLANKVKAGLIFIASAEELGDKFEWNEESQKLAKDLLANVTNDPKTVEEAQSKADEFVKDHGGVEPGPGPGPNPDPGPGPGPGPGATFTVNESDGVYTFGGTATGDITVEFNDQDVAAFTRQGITSTIDLSAWNFGDRFSLLNNETLALTFAQANAFTELGQGSLAVTLGAVKITDAHTPIAANTSLTGFATQFNFLGATELTVASGATFKAMNHVVNNLPIKGEGSVEIQSSTGTASINLDIQTNGDSVFGGDAGADVLSGTGAGRYSISGGRGADQITLGGGADTLSYEFGGDIDASPSAVTINVTDAAAGGAAHFSITLSGVNADAPISFDVSTATDGEALADAIQTELQSKDGNETDISVAWENDQIIITDSKGRDFSSPSLTDADDAEIDSGISISFGNVAGSLPSDSTLTGFDTVTNFAIGADKISLFPVVIPGQGNQGLPQPDALVRVADIATSEDLTAALTTAFESLNAKEAGLVVISAGAVAGTYLYADDGNGDVDADNDLFIKLVEYTGTLDNLTVSDFFI